MIGAGNIMYGSRQSSGSGSGTITGANDGLTVTGGNTVVLGQSPGQLGDPAQLLGNRHIPFNGFSMELVNLLDSSTVTSGVSFWDSFPEDIQQNGDGTTTPDGNGGYILAFTPVNYNITYPSNYNPPSDTVRMDRWTWGYTLAASDDFPPTGMPDAVINFGYNTNPNAGRTNPGDAAWRMGFETHFINDLEGPVANFEFHLPEVTTYAGTPVRTNSFYVAKQDGYCLWQNFVNIHSYLSSATGTPWLNLSRTPGNGSVVQLFPDSTSGLALIETSGAGNGNMFLGTNFFDYEFATVAGEFVSPIYCQRFGAGDNRVYLNVNFTAGSAANAAGTTTIGQLTAAASDHYPSAQLAVLSLTKGFLKPFMSDAQKNSIPSPAAGLEVFDTDRDVPSWYSNNAVNWINWGEVYNSIFTPTTGTTVNLLRGELNVINPSGTLAALTLNFPTGLTPNDFIEIKFTQSVTAITTTGATVVDGLPSATAGLYTKYQWNGSSWY